MNRVFVVAAALGLLLLLRQVVPPGGAEGVEPMTLAAIGFVVLTAFTVGEVGRTARLPRITGYILSGVALGPQVSDLLSAGVVRDMKVFNTLALGLIALTAGLELDLRAIRRVLTTLLGTLAAKLPLLLTLVGGTFFGLETAFGLVGVEDDKHRLAISLLLGVLGIGTSPAIVLAVSNEAGAKGRLTDLALALAVVKDLVVVVSLAIAIAVARSLVAPGADLGLDVLASVAEELVGSLLAGVVIGSLLNIYIRFVHLEMLLVVLVVVLVGAEVARALHLELLLVFITAGFVVRNLSAHAEELHHPLERVALPVFVVFFTTAGATVDLRATAAVLPLALALVTARMLAYFFASRFGAWLGREGPEVRRQAWLTYWPQAGITLGLVNLAASALPELASALTEMGFAVVAVNLLVGPVAVGFALRRAGEVGESRAEVARKTGDLPKSGATDRPALEPVRPLPPPVPDPRPTLKGKLETEPLIGTVTELATDLEGMVEDFLRLRVAPLVQETRTLADRMLAEALEARGVIIGVRKALKGESVPFAEAWEEATEDLRRELVGRILELPDRLQAPLSDGLLVPRASDSWWVRASRVRLRVLRRLSDTAGRWRTVRLQVLARHRLEPRIARGLRALSSANFEHYARVLDQVRAVVAGISSPAEARAGVRALSERWLQACRHEMQLCLREGVTEVADLASEAGAPGAEAARLRLSQVQARIVADVEGLRRDTRRWRRVAVAGIDTLRAEAFAEEAEEKLALSLAQRAREPIGIIPKHIIPVVEQVGKRLEAVRTEVETTPADRLDLQAVKAKLESALRDKEAKTLERARATFGRQARHAQIPEDLARLRANAPERIDLLPTGALVDAHQHPERVAVVQVAFAERLDGAVAGLVGQIRDAMADIENLVVASEGRLRDATHLVGYGVEAAIAFEVDPEARRATAARALARGKAALDDLAKEISEAARTAESGVDAASARVREVLRALVRDQRPSTVARVRSSFRAQGLAVRTALADTVESLAAGLRRLRMGVMARLGLAPEVSPPRDAGELRRAIEVDAPAPAALGLPAIYVKVFDPAPVGDQRIAVARSNEVEHVARLLGLRGGPLGTVVIEGGSGAGRTSFLNMLGREARPRRVVRIDAAFHPRDEGLVGALAADMGCGDYPLAVTQALLSEPTVVLIDDLGHHVMPTPDGVSELQELFRIVVDTTGKVAWAVSSESTTLAVLAELVPVYGVFTERHVVRSVDGETLERVIDARANLAGLDVRFPRPALLKMIGRYEARLRRARRAYFHRLAAASRGNLREAIILHLRSLRVEPDGSLRATHPEPAAVPKLSGLAPRSLACLGLIARFGPLREAELAEVLLLTTETIRQHTTALVHAGLLDRDDQRMLRIPLHLQRPISRGLQDLGAPPGSQAPKAPSRPSRPRGQASRKVQAPAPGRRPNGSSEGRR